MNMMNALSKTMNRRDWLATTALGLCTAASGALLAEEIRKTNGNRKIKTILLISGWQDINIGDITHTTGLLHVLETYFPDTKIILWKSKFDDPNSPAITMIRRCFPKVEIIKGSVDRKDFSIKGDDVRKAIDEADIFLHGSGPSVVRWDALTAWSKTTSKPFGVFGTTIERMNPALKEVLDKSAFIFTRETASLKTLEEHGITGMPKMFVPDATFDLNTRDDETADKFLAERKLENRKFLCVIPRLRWTPYPGRMEKEPEKQQTNDKYKEQDHAKAREAIVAWVEKTKLPVLVCPEMTYQVDIMDELLIDPLPESVKPFVQKRGYWMPDEAASVYAKAHTVISFECHSPIIATAMGTPAFYLRQPEDTIKGQMYYDLGMNDWVFEINETSGKQIADRLLDVVADYVAALAKVKKVNDLTTELFAKGTDIANRS